MNLRPLSQAGVLALILGAAPAVANAQDADRHLTLQPLADADKPAPPTQPLRDPPSETPKHAFVESAFNLSSGAVYVALTGTAIGGELGGKTSVDAQGHVVAAPASSGSEAQGGVLVGGSPINGLTFHAFVGQDNENKFAPILTIHYRILGSIEDGYALGVFAQYKTDGFGDAHGEIEVGPTFGLRKNHIYFDANAVGGGSTDPDNPLEEGEADLEARLRGGYEITDAFRVGVEGQVRKRISGAAPLAGGRTADGAVGPQVVGYVGPVVVGATGGATTVDIARNVGGFGLLTIGAFAR